MLDLKLIRENPEEAIARLKVRGADFDIDGLLVLDEERRAQVRRVESFQRQRNEASKEIGRVAKEGGDVAAKKEAVRKIGDEMKLAEAEFKALDANLTDRLLTIPNLPHESVPPGADESANIEVREWGRPKEFSFAPKAHHELGETLKIIDFKRAAKLSGARFAILQGAGARMERALINLMLDLHTTEHGYTEVLPPFMVNSDTMRGTGQLPKFADDLFKIEGRDLWLIPTAEAPVTNIRAGEIIDGDELPLKMTAYTPCFRAEAGSYGKDTTGLIRQHQFDKVELVQVVLPEESEAALEQLTGQAEAILKLLGLPFRVVTLCGGDLGFSAAKTYDIEVWVPSQNKYREISSCSTFTDYQSRRMNMRFRSDKKAKPAFPHTINGSGLAVGRTLVAILENYQNEDGSITIPEALRPYMGGLESIGQD